QPDIWRKRWLEVDLRLADAAGRALDSTPSFVVAASRHIGYVEVVPDVQRHLASGFVGRFAFRRVRSLPSAVARKVVDEQLQLPQRCRPTMAPSRISRTSRSIAAKQ